jgi:hypothetical protein
MRAAWWVGVGLMTLAACVAGSPADLGDAGLGTGGTAGEVGIGGWGGGSPTGGSGGLSLTGGSGGAIATGGSGGSAVSGGSGGVTPTGGTGGTVAATGIEVFYDTHLDTVTQYGLSLQLRNQDSATVDLGTITLRFWIGADGLSMAASCDYVSIGTAASMLVSVVSVPSPADPTADTYLEIGFPAGTMLSGSGSVMVNFRLYADPRVTLDRTNDYSYTDATINGLNDHITVYQNGGLVYGVEPGT